MTNARRLLTAALLAALTACADSTVTRPSFGKGAGSSDPTVTGTSPTGAGQDTTLDVRVFGTNYDRGSRADLALGGVIGPKVRTNSTQYVSSTELVANITIAADADTGAYDIVVTASTGKKGIGTEMFQVRKSPPGNPEPPPPVIPPTWTYRDLDQGAGSVVYNTGYGLSSAGWVFVTDGGSGTPGLVYRTDQAPVTIETLPGTVGSNGAGNPRGDYLTLLAPPGAGLESRLMMRGTDGTWRLSQSFARPPGWVRDWAHGVNDNLLVVGQYEGDSRSYLTKQGQRRYYYTPIAWQLNGDGTTRQTFLLNLPAPTVGCRLTHVSAEGVNLSGRIVGYATQEAAVNKAVCVRRALYWDPPYDDPLNGPHDLAPSPEPMKDPYPVGSYDLWYSATAINDAGDVAGWLVQSNGSTTGRRAVRWMHGSYASPEVLTGWVVVEMGIDECGRVLVGGVNFGTAGVWPLYTDAMLSLPMPAGWSVRGVGDIRNGRVTGSGQTSSSAGWHAFLWTLDACPGM